MNVRLEKAFMIVATAAVLIDYGMWTAGQEMYYDLPIIGDRVYAYYLFAGHFLYKYRKHIRFRQRTVIAAGILGIAASFGITLAVTVIQGDHYEGVLTYDTPFIILAGMCFFLVMVRFRNCRFTPGRRGRKIIDLFGGCSFGIYLIHILFLDHYKKYMEPWDLSAWAAVPALIGGITAVSFVCVWVIRRFGLGRMIT